MKGNKSSSDEEYEECWGWKIRWEELKDFFFYKKKNSIIIIK